MNVTAHVNVIVTEPEAPPVLVHVPVAAVLEVSVISYVNAATQVSVAPAGFVAVRVKPFALTLPETLHLRY